MKRNSIILMIITQLLMSCNHCIRIEDKMSNWTSSEPYIKETSFTVEKDMDIVFRLKIKMKEGDGEIVVKDEKSKEILWNHNWNTLDYKYSDTVTLKDLKVGRKYTVIFTSHYLVDLHYSMTSNTQGIHLIAS